MSKRRVLAVLLVMSAVCAAPLVTRAQDAFPASSLAACGVERWTVKTLGDRPVLRPSRTGTLRYLVTRPAPRSLPDRRLPFERNAFTVFAAVTLAREDDGDLQLVLQSGRYHMIAEAPTFVCTIRAKLPLRRAMATARSRVRICSHTKLTGVAFFDYKHGQTGVAPNGIELHPLLGFHCLTG